VRPIGMVQGANGVGERKMATQEWDMVLNFDVVRFDGLSLRLARRWETCVDGTEQEGMGD